MQNELTITTQNTNIEDFKKQGLIFNTVTNKMLNEIQEYKPEITRARNSFGKSQTQFMRNLMTFDAHTPLRNLRQILAEIEGKEGALKEAQYKHNKQLIKLDKLNNKPSTPSTINKTHNIKQGIATSSLYIEGAIKEIHAMQDTYKQIMVLNKIDRWDEEDFEKEEEEYHIKQAFTQGIADLQQGALSPGNNIYFRQIGVNPIQAELDIRIYINTVKEVVAKGNLVTMREQYAFIDGMYNKYKGSRKIASDRVGIKQTYNDSSCFLEDKETKK